MSRPVPSARALRALKAQLNAEPYVCLSCTPSILKRPSTRARSHQHASRTWSRSASTVAPVTSVNASRNVPEANRELHNALSSMEQHAISYVNFSQLTLALRGLESRDPVTRIAIRQCGTAGASRRLVRLLLADPLAEEEDEEWEEMLDESGGDARSLLIRYGVEADYNTSNSLYRILSVPAPILQKNRLEILLLLPNAPEGSFQGGAVVPEEALVTKVETPISKTGRYSQVTYPVHKAITIGSGLKGIRNVPALSAEQAESNVRHLIGTAVDVPWDNPQQLLEHEGLHVISLAQAERALEKIRESTRKGTDYEHDWLESKIADIHGFILDGTQPSTSVKPAHHAFISHIIASAAAAVEVDEAKAASKVVTEDELAETLKPLEETITQWSETAHTELRNELANAFASRSWRKLAWYKLPFRVDDVSMIGSDIIGRYYLVDAEKGIVWVAGRLEQAGLTKFSDNQIAENSSSDPSRRDSFDSVREIIKEDLQTTRETPLTYFRPNLPWPQQIAMSRAQLLTVALPSLQARAQALLLQAFTTSSMATAIGGLAYAMVSTTGLYEAGAVASLGIAISARRLQKLWGQAKDKFVKEVQEEGRIVLEETEQGCRDVVKAHRVPKVDETIEDRAKAREAIARAGEVLDSLK